MVGILKQYYERSEARRVIWKKYLKKTYTFNYLPANLLYYSQHVRELLACYMKADNGQWTGKAKKNIIQSNLSGSRHAITSAQIISVWM